MYCLSKAFVVPYRIVPYRIVLALGTGTNACYVEKLDNVELWDGDDKPPRQVRPVLEVV